MSHLPRSGFTRSFFTSCKSFMPKKKPKYLYPELHQAKAQKNFDRTEHKEIVDAQKLRHHWEFPVQADQRTNWKHRRWYDVYFNKWVSTLPKPPHGFSVYYKDQRKFIFEAETPDELFKLLLDTYGRRKYVITSFDQETPITNISYYYQHLTNTKYIHGLPMSINNAMVDEEYLENFRFFVNELLLNEHNSKEFLDETDPSKKSAIFAASVIKAIVQYLVVTLASENSNLSQLEIDHNAENCMFWFRGAGFLKWTLPDDHPFAFQCHDPVLMQVRTKQELPAFSPREGQFSTSGEVPSFYTSPHIFKVVPFAQYRNSILSGYKLFAGDCNQNYQFAKDEGLLHELPPPTYNQCKYGHTQIHLLPETYSRDWYKENLEHSDISGEVEEHLKGKGIMSGWVWTGAQAHYQQHWMDNDIKEPFCSQSIVTDGQWLSFFCYQLNTVSIDAENMVGNNKRNLCFGRTSLKLFDEITSDNKVVGLNDEALILLVKFLRNGAEQHKSVVSGDDQLEEYNAKLPVQEVDPEKPDIELQKPLHKQELDRIREETRKAKEKEEQKKKTFLGSFKEMYKSMTM